MFHPTPLSILISLNLLLASCAAQLPSSLAESSTSYGYVPIDPLPIVLGRSDCLCGVVEKGTATKRILDGLGDQTVRLAVAEYSASGNLSFGVGNVGIEGRSYQVVLDYMNTDIVPGAFYVQRTVSGLYTVDTNWFSDIFFNYVPAGFKEGQTISIYQRVPKGVLTRYHVVAAGKELSPLFATTSTKPRGYEELSLAVYVGVGLRVTANVTVLKGNVKLNGLSQIAAEAQAGRLSGSLVVQTLGVTGPSVSTTMPLPSKVDTSTIEQAILAVGSIKAVLYGQGSDVTITPRVVGIYNQLGSGEGLVDGIISALSQQTIHWNRPCKTAAVVE